jgi:hypothetical protein
VRGGALSAAKNESGDCSILFSDGVAVLATAVSLGDGACRLDVGPYTTGAGTPIPAKSWVVDIAPMEGDRSRFRIRKKFSTP